MTNINGHEVVNVDALIVKVSLKVGFGLDGTRSPPFFKKKIRVPCRPRPIQEEMWDALILLKKTYIRPNENGKITSFSLLPFGKDGQLSGKKKFSLLSKKQVFHCITLKRFFLIEKSRNQLNNIKL